MIGALVGQRVVYQSESGVVYSGIIEKLRSWETDTDWDRSIFCHWRSEGVHAVGAWVPEPRCIPGPTYDELLQLDLQDID